MKSFLTRRAPSLLLVAVLTACSSLETRITQPEDQPSTMELRVEVASLASGASAAPAPSLNVTVDDDQGNSLNLGEVLIVLDQVEFRRASGEGCVPSDDPEEDDGDACAEVVVEPTILELPVDQGIMTAANIAVEAGTYEALEFDVHVVTEEDANVISQVPALLGGSVQVRGSFNDGSGGTALGDSAVFAPEERMVLELDDPIELDDGVSGTVTLTVDVESWFLIDGALVRPDEAAQDTSLSRQVSENILDSFSLRPGG